MSHVLSTTDSTLSSTRSEPDASVNRVAPLERTLQINVAMLVVLGTSLLAMGQQNILYALVALIAACASVILCDIQGRVRLGPDATTLAAVLSCVVLVVQVIRNVEQSHLLNVANVLIYLEMILLFQTKEDRSYWSLMVLSFLQVIVAAALNLGLVFGILLGVYVLAAFTALMLFYLVRETRQFIEAGHGLRTARSETVSFFAPLADDAPQQALNRSLFLRLCRTILVTACGAGIAFFAVPRFNSTAWQSPDQEQIATVGFTEEVRLDDIGRILESPEQVMRVEFTNLDGTPYQVDGEPYFRGTVLSNYDRKSKAWQQTKLRNSVKFRRRTNLDLSNTVAQHIALQPGSHSALFHVAPCYYIDGSPGGLELNPRSGQLTISGDDASSQGVYRYKLGTTAFRNGWQRDLIPAQQDSPFDLGFNVRQQFPALTAIADEIIESQGLRDASTFDRAKALESYFRRSGLFRYSLESSPDRNRDLDPIEDFVANHRSGHCEYFAGALVMMLRSQNIKAHMVVGYKGGEFNTVGNFYIVRQLHAHAWVEALLAYDEIPDDDGDRYIPEGLSAWLTLDATPGSADVNLDNNRLPVITRVRELIDYCQVLWDDYVLGLNAMRQEQAIYGPIRRNLKAIWDAVFTSDAWQGRWQWIVNTYHYLWRQRLLGIPLLPVVAASVLSVAAMLIRHRKQIAIHRPTWLRSNSAKQAATTRVDWVPYMELLEILRSLDIVRQSQETPTEFAATAKLRLASHQQLQAWQGLPAEITRVYCRLRYGAGQVTRELDAPFQEPLAALKAAAQAKPQNKPPTTHFG